jgi:hypothetical protein
MNFLEIGALGSFLAGLVAVIGYLKKINETYDNLKKEMDKVLANKVDREELREYINLVISPLKEAVEKFENKVDRLFDKLIEVNIKHDD